MMQPFQEKPGFSRKPGFFGQGVIFRRGGLDDKRHLKKHSNAAEADERDVVVLFAAGGVGFDGIQGLLAEP